MRNMTESEITAEVLKRYEGTTNPRIKQLMTNLISHLHAFVREVELTEDEWFAAIQFLTDTGKMCSDTRQEYILLSDTLGVSMLVDLINHRKPEGATESTVFGPFYMAGAPEMEYGGNIAQQDKGPACFISGRVTSLKGTPIKGAVLDVWQTSTNGFYSSQDSNQPKFNMRGKFRTDAQGRYLIQTARSVSYPIPVDGPVGKTLQLTARHPNRPAHVHFIVSADGFEPVTTHLFDDADPYIDSDAVFGVKSSLLCQFVRHDSQEEAVQRNVSAPFYTVEYDFALVPR
ncbi:MAG: intradiol ring-cleavage dioxygenase [Candidatus Binatia bacterium]